MRLSKPRELWWPYVKNILRAYPANRKKLDAIRQQKITPQYSPVGGGSSGPGRTTEQTALRELPAQRMKEIEAIEATLGETNRLSDGQLRTHLIRLVYFKKRYNLEGAANACHISYRTARRWQSAFFYLLAEKLGIR